MEATSGYFERDPAKEKAWLQFTDSEYYHRCVAILLSYGMGEGDVDVILSNFWSDGFNRGGTPTLKSDEQDQG